MASKESKALKESKAKVSAVNLRPDGRAPGEFRSTSFKLNIMRNVDGSCLYEQGNAKVTFCLIHYFYIIFCDLGVVLSFWSVAKISNA